jgi:hypothetical protein
MNNNLEIIELEVERIVQLFAQARSLKIKVYFGRTGDRNFPQGTNDPRKGFCFLEKVLDRYEVYIRLDRNSRALIFQTLAHELAHAWQMEIEKEKKERWHNPLFWKIMDEKTFPFVEENLSEIDRANLVKLLNPTTNFGEDIDWVYLDDKESKIVYLIEKENIDRAWRLVRGEAIKGNLSAKVTVSTAKRNKDKYKIVVYARKEEDASLLTEKLQSRGFKYKPKID